MCNIEGSWLVIHSFLNSLNFVILTIDDYKIKVKSEILILNSLFQVHQMTREATCYEPSSGLQIPLLDLRLEDQKCHVSALSDSAYKPTAVAILPALLLTIFLTPSRPRFLILAILLISSTTWAIRFSEIYNKSWLEFEFMQKNIQFINIELVLCPCLVTIFAVTVTMCPNLITSNIWRLFY